jgi:hypothetical protein
MNATGSYLTNTFVEISLALLMALVGVTFSLALSDSVLALKLALLAFSFLFVLTILFTLFSITRLRRTWSWCGCRSRDRSGYRGGCWHRRGRCFGLSGDWRRGWHRSRWRGGCFVGWSYSRSRCWWWGTLLTVLFALSSFSFTFGNLKIAIFSELKEEPRNLLGQYIG